MNRFFVRQGNGNTVIANKLVAILISVTFLLVWFNVSNASAEENSATSDSTTVVAKPGDNCIYSKPEKTADSDTATADNTDSTATTGSADSAETSGTAVAQPLCTVVANTNTITEDEKEAIKTAIQKANQDADGKSTLPEGSVITVGVDGTAVVTDNSEEIATFGPDKTIVLKREVKTPSDKVTVADPNNLTDEEKAKIKQAFVDTNKGLKVENINFVANDIVIADNPYFKDVKISQIEAEQSDKKWNIIVPERTTVADWHKLTEEEQGKVKQNFITANKHLDEEKITVSDTGVVTIAEDEHYNDKTIEPAYAVQSGDNKEYDSLNNPEEPVAVDDTNALTTQEKEAVVEAVKKANPDLSLDGTTIRVADNGEVTIANPDYQEATIYAFRTVKRKGEVNLPKKVWFTEETPVSELKESIKAAIVEANKDTTVDSDSIVVADDGSVEINDPNHKEASFTPEDTVYKIIYPTTTAVDNAQGLTDTEKNDVYSHFLKANPKASLPSNTSVTVGDDGSITVSNPAFTKDFVINGSKTVTQKKTVTNPVITKVNDASDLDETEKEAVKTAIVDKNSGIETSSIQVQDDGTVKIIDDPTYITTTISPSDTVEQKADVNPPADKVSVDNIYALTETEKEAVEAALKAANPEHDFATDSITVNPDGKIIIADDSYYRNTVILPEKTIVQRKRDIREPELTFVVAASLTKEEKAEVVKKVQQANSGLEDNAIEVADDGTVTIYADGAKRTITNEDGTTEDIIVNNIFYNPGTLAKEKTILVMKGCVKLIPSTGVAKDAERAYWFDFSNCGTEVTEGIERFGHRRNLGESLSSVNTVARKITVDGKTFQVQFDVQLIDKLFEETRTNSTPVMAVNPTPKYSWSIFGEQNCSGNLDSSTCTQKNYFPADPEHPDHDPATAISFQEGRRGAKYKYTFKVTNIRVSQPADGNKKRSYGILLGDAEQTNNDDDKVTVKSDQPVNLFTQLFGNSQKVRAVRGNVASSDFTENEYCSGGKEGLNTNTFICQGQTKTKPSEPVFITRDPTEVNITVEGKNGNAYTYGVVFKKTVIMPHTLVSTQLYDGATPKKTLTDSEKQEIINTILDANNPKVNAAGEKDENGSRKADGLQPENIQVSEDGTVKIVNTDQYNEDTFTPSETVVVDPTITDVVDRNHLTDTEKKAVEKATRDANPPLPKGSTIEVKDDGKVFITLPDGSKIQVGRDKTVRQKVKAPEKQSVKNPNKLTDAEKEAIKNALIAANQPDSEHPGDPQLQPEQITVADNGSVTITGNDKYAATTFKPVQTISSPLVNPEKTQVADPTNLTSDEQAKVKQAVKDANPALPENAIEVDSRGNVTIKANDFYPEGTFKPTQTVFVGNLHAPERTLVADPTDISKGDDGNASDEVFTTNKVAIIAAVLKANPGLKESDIKEVTKQGKVILNKSDFYNAGEFTPQQTIKAKALKTPAKTQVKNPTNLTNSEKDAVKAAVVKANPGLNQSDIEVDSRGNVTVKRSAFYDSGRFNRNDTVQSTVNNPVRTVVLNPDKLTSREKDSVINAVVSANPGINSKNIKVADDGTVTITDPIYGNQELKRENVIKAEFKNPTRITVKDPDHLTDEEKQQVKDSVVSANVGISPDAITVADDGTVTVKDSIYGNNTVKRQNAIKDEEINLPQRVPVVDPDHLTQAEKDRLIAELVKVNNSLQASSVKVADDGTITINGDPIYVNGEDAEGNNIKNRDNTVIKLPKRVVVNDRSHLTDEEKQAVEEAIKQANPQLFADDAEVKVDKVEVADDGTTTITYTDGTTVVIGSVDTTMQIPGKVKVANPNNLSAAEKIAVRKQIRKANPDIPLTAEIKVDARGNVTVVYPNGTIVELSREQVIYATVNAPLKVKVKDANHLTAAEMQAVKEAVIAANPGIDPEKITVSENGSVQFEGDSMYGSFTLTQSQTVYMVKELALTGSRVTNVVLIATLIITIGVSLLIIARRKYKVE